VGLFILGLSKSSVGEQCLLDLLELAALMQAVGIIVGIVIALLQLRDLGKTRKADLLMELYATYRTKDFNRDYMEILHHSWKDVFDWIEVRDGWPIAKNLQMASIWLSVLLYFEGVGVLLNRKMIDIALVDDLLSSEILLLWEKMGPAVKALRVRTNLPQLYEHFEHLYEKMKRRDQELSGQQRESSEHRKEIETDCGLAHAD